MSDIIDESMALAKECPDLKVTLNEKTKELRKLNTASKASMTKHLVIEREVFIKTMNIMGQSINDAEIEIEALETKNTELEKELTVIDKARINKVYETKKQQLQSDSNYKQRIMKRLHKTINQSKALTG